MTTAPLARLIGRTLANKYAIDSLVGTGGMGAVYKARQIALDKWVAVKVLHRDLADEPKFVERFKREAFSASRLDHPNSLRVLDFGEDDGLLYLVMEYFQADDLLVLMNREWPLEDRRVVRIVSQALAALAVAHDLGIVHRDLKPENILVVRGPDDEGELVDIVKVCDFGVAKLAPRNHREQEQFGPRLTVDGLAVGTPDYMSPEQARGEHVDGRSDLYSMGVVLYHLLAGRTPFTGDSALGVALQHVSDEPPPPSRWRDVHPGLEAVCLRALAKRPADRYPSAREMRRALREALESPARVSCSTPPFVLTRAVVPTPQSTTLSQPDLAGFSPPAPVLRRRKVLARARQAILAAAGGAALGALIAASLPASRHALLERLRGPLELVQTVAAAHLAPQRHGDTSAVLVDPQPVHLAESPDIATAVEPPSAVLDEAMPAKTRRPPVVAPRRLVEVPTTPSPFVDIADTKSSKPADPAALAGAIAAGPPPVQIPPPAPVLQTPPPAAFDPSHAYVGISAIRTSSGILGNKVRAALSRLPIAGCYRQALRERNAPVALQASLEIAIDVTGHIVSSSLSRDGNLPGLRDCVEAEVRAAQIRDIDTGEGVAAIELTFTPQ